MLTAVAQVETDRPSRYLVQLCKHADQMGGGRLRHRRPPHLGGDTHAPPEVRRVEWSDTRGTIATSLGTCTLQATTDALTLRAEAIDEESLRRIEELLAARLEGIGRRDGLTVKWRRLQAPVLQKDGASDAPMFAGKMMVHRRHRTSIVLAAVAALVIAVHVGLGGAVLAASRWTAWATNIVLVVVLVKVLAVGATALHRYRIRRSKAATTDEQ